MLDVGRAGELQHRLEHVVEPVALVRGKVRPLRLGVVARKNVLAPSPEHVKVDLAQDVHVAPVALARPELAAEDRVAPVSGKDAARLVERRARGVHVLAAVLVDRVEEPRRLRDDVLVLVVERLRGAVVPVAALRVVGGGDLVVARPVAPPARTVVVLAVGREAAGPSLGDPVAADLRHGIGVGVGVEGPVVQELVAVFGDGGPVWAQDIHRQKAVGIDLVGGIADGVVLRVELPVRAGVGRVALPRDHAEVAGAARGVAVLGLEAVAVEVVEPADAGGEGQLGIADHVEVHVTLFRDAHLGRPAPEKPARQAHHAALVDEAPRSFPSLRQLAARVQVARQAVRQEHGRIVAVVAEEVRLARPGVRHVPVGGGVADGGSPGVVRVVWHVDEVGPVVDVLGRAGPRCAQVVDAVHLPVGADVVGFRARPQRLDVEGVGDDLVVPVDDDEIQAAAAEAGLAELVPGGVGIKAGLYVAVRGRAVPDGVARAGAVGVIGGGQVGAGLEDAPGVVPADAGRGPVVGVAPRDVESEIGEVVHLAGAVRGTGPRVIRALPPPASADDAGAVGVLVHRAVLVVAEHADAVIGDALREHLHLEVVAIGSAQAGVHPHERDERRGHDGEHRQHAEGDDEGAAPAGARGARRTDDGCDLTGGKEHGVLLATPGSLACG